MTSVLRIPGSGNPSSNLKWSMDLGFEMRNLLVTVGVERIKMPKRGGELG